MKAGPGRILAALVGELPGLEDEEERAFRVGRPITCHKGAAGGREKSQASFTVYLER
jgi:hypothetical protein